MHAGYVLYTPEDKVKLWQSEIQSATVHDTRPTSMVAYPPLSIYNSPVYIPSASYYPYGNMAHAGPAQPGQPLTLIPAYHGEPSQDLQLQTGPLEWEQYIQDSWQERQTAPPDLAKFKSPSNIRGAPLEAEPSLPSPAGRAHHRMDTFNSIASTTWDSTFDDTYNFIDPLRRDSEPAEATTFSVLQDDPSVAAQMTAPLSSLMLHEGLTHTQPQHAPEGLQDVWHQPTLAHNLGEAVLQSQSLKTYSSHQPRPEHLFHPYLSSSGTASSVAIDSRRASSATVSSIPLLSPEEYLYSAAPVTLNHHVEPAYRGFLGESRPPALNPDYFAEINSFHPVEHYPPPASPLQLLPVPAGKPAALHLGGPAETNYSSGPTSAPVGGSFIPYKRRRVSSVTMPVRPAASRLRTMSTLRIPPLTTEHGEPDTSVETDPIVRFKRLTSPVASVRPADADEDGTAILDVESSGEESDDLGLDQETGASQGQFVHLSKPSTKGTRVGSQGPVPGRGHSVPSVLQPVEALEASVNANTFEPSSADDDSQPRKQKLRFAEDAYTPLWVKGAATQKEGLCDMCPAPGRWLQLKNSAFWYHKQFTHGISSVSGAPFTPPSEMRKSKDSGGSEGLCHQCQQWIPYSTKRQDASEAEIVPTLWYKHAHKCHQYDTSKIKTAANTQRNSRTNASKKRRNTSPDDSEA